MGLIAKGGEERIPSANPRSAGGPPEGTPGATVSVMIHDVMPPMIFMAVVQDDGWFSDEVYEQIAAARAPR
ncbi:MAG: hypothetical protein RJA49_382 [Actinomycetota bacterium]|jgi:hypothetical protein